MWRPVWVVSVRWIPVDLWTPECSALPSTWKNSNAAHGALINCRDYLQIDTVYFHCVCYRWCSLSSSLCWFRVSLCVWSWHFGCGEQSVSGASRPLGFGPTSCFYQARGEDSLGLLGLSGVWVSLRALCKTKPIISSDLCLFHRIIFRFRAHLLIPQTAALCGFISL